VSQDINVLALVKGLSDNVFLYDDASRAETLRTLGRYASNPELSFTWYDAASSARRSARNAKFHATRASKFHAADPDEF